MASNEGDTILDLFVGGGTGNVKQRGDFGLDGKTGDNTPIQVKHSDNIGRNVIDNFLSAVQRYDKKHLMIYYNSYGGKHYDSFW